MEHGFFFELLIILTTSLGVIALFHRFRIPATLGYLSVGVLIGPGGLSLITNQHAIEYLAEFGVVFLLFSLGLEFALPRMIAMRRAVFGMGLTQVLVCTLAFFAAASLIGMRTETSLIIAGAFALSSTAIVTKELTLGRQLHARFGQLAFAVLLLQDLASVFFLVMIPTFALGGDHMLWAMGWALMKTVALLGILMIVGARILPFIFMEVAKSRSEELFVLAAIVVVLLAGALTHLAGLSMALGAFIAGMMLGESHFRHQIEAEIRPFRDVLLGIFFVTVGMLMDLRVLAEAWYWVILITLGVMVFKTLTITVIGRLLRETWDNSLKTGISLAQGGEFGFAMLAVAASNGLVGPETSAIVLACIILSMTLTPLLIRSNSQLTQILLPRASSSQGGQSVSLGSVEAATAKLNNHVVICGFGRVGQAVGRFLRQEKIPFVAVDSDPIRVQEATLAGENVHYGDSRQGALLRALGLERARMVVIAFDNFPQAQVVLNQIRSIQQEVPVLVRTADDSHWEELREAGATEVVPETLEGSLMLISHVLTMLEVPAYRIRERIREVRSQRYQLLHGYLHGERSRTTDNAGNPVDVIHAVPLAEKAYAVGRTLEELALERTGLYVQALRRRGITWQNPDAQIALEADDILVLLGTAQQIESAENFLLGGGELWTAAIS
ncbi:MAG: cation:proton antiporter [Pseudomonadota bacterium]|nr:cation:proton antiporter [Pseudomonadota bacterium]